MSNHNEITGDKLQSKVGDQTAFSKGWDSIFGGMTQQELFPPTCCTKEVLPEQEYHEYKGCCGDCH